ncbi:MAG: UvrD-helicase domain-containing protein [Desulfosalsimonadaceae bacterium]
MQTTPEAAPADAEQREAALDPGSSFIVQAPAGSGKTGLLIQRYLCLLARVEAPEEILAITFTRKASAEMRSRILESLQQAEKHPPAGPHERKTWELACAARSRARQFCWELSDNPGRLRIQTIDALCAAIVRQMPCLSRFGAPPEVSEDPQPLYLEAARRTLAELEAGSRWSSPIEALVRHMDNQLERLEQMIAGMLAKRDQWLRHLAAPGNPQLQRRQLEEGLQFLITEALADCSRPLPADCIEQLLDLARFAAANLEAGGARSPIVACRDLSDLPPARPEALEQWLGICELLVTGGGTWRRRADKNLGFPPPGSAEKGSGLRRLYEEKKREFSELLQRLSDQEQLCRSLDMLRYLPEPRYGEGQWQIMQALFEILRLSVAHLEIVFRSAGKADFAEVALRAANALGTPEHPTDLGLAMDCRIQHILIDEFQDTSITQFTLLEKLTMGWQPGDGRSFFAVGDPMQSIYGFREAEVGLFLKARSEGLGQIHLQPLTLSVNFRSQQKLVDWVNESFPFVFPQTSDAATGAVAYAPAVSALEPEPGPAAEIHPIVPLNRETEAETVLDCIGKAKEQDPGGSIAVLARSRPHLENSLALLKARGISFTAVEIESLKDRPVIQDLLSLTRALSHPADRIAWLAVLRAPWCGLSLADLHALAGDSPGVPVFDLLGDHERAARFTGEGKIRAARVREALAPALENRGRRSLRRLVEGAWLKLGGPACCFTAAELADAAAYLELVDETAGSGFIGDMAAFEQSVSRLFARADTDADERLQVMTIHKAKGLEFDTVILPGLDRPPPSEESRLLMWLERSSGRRSDLLLAPVQESGSQRSGAYEYIRLFEKKKRAFEDTRLLYVAATRARKRLHLIGGAKQAEEGYGLRPPDPRSLLAPLWPVVSGVFSGSAEGQAEQIPLEESGQAARQTAESGCIRRLCATWQAPETPSGLEHFVPRQKEVPSPEPQNPPFDWAGETVRRVGTVMHRWLRVICEQGLQKWNRRQVQAFSPRFRRDLQAAGISGNMLDAAEEQVKTALSAAIEDAVGRWILCRHRQDACEYALTGLVSGRRVNVVIDRTFVDEAGVRWIIDYKSSVHTGGSVKLFLDREKARYEEQMAVYGRLLEATENRPMYYMLYFPQLRSYRQWPAQ